jgi:hypothetical protein
MAIRQTARRVKFILGATGILATLLNLSCVGSRTPSKIPRFLATLGLDSASILKRLNQDWRVSPDSTDHLDDYAVVHATLDPFDIGAAGDAEFSIANGIDSAVTWEIIPRDIGPNSEALFNRLIDTLKDYLGEPTLDTKEYRRWNLASMEVRASLRPAEGLDVRAVFPNSDILISVLDAYLRLHYKQRFGQDSLHN